MKRFRRGIHGHHAIQQQRGSAQQSPGVIESLVALPRGQLPQMQAITHMRLIVDPITSVAYRRDVRRYSYWSNGAAAPNHALTESEKISIVSSSLPTADVSRH
jgi:hypothetical protein